MVRRIAVEPSSDLRVRALPAAGPVGRKILKSETFRRSATFQGESIKFLAQTDLVIANVRCSSGAWRERLRAHAWLFYHTWKLQYMLAGTVRALAGKSWLTHTPPRRLTGKDQGSFTRRVHSVTMEVWGQGNFDVVHAVRCSFQCSVASCAQSSFAHSGCERALRLRTVLVMESSRSAVLQQTHDRLSNPESTVENVLKKGTHDLLISTHVLIHSPCSSKFWVLKQNCISPLMMRSGLQRGGRRNSLPIDDWLHSLIETHNGQGQGLMSSEDIVAFDSGPQGGNNHGQQM